MKKFKKWTILQAYRAGVADGRMREAYDRDGTEKTDKEWFDEGVRRGFLWIVEV